MSLRGNTHSPWSLITMKRETAHEKWHANQRRPSELMASAPASGLSAPKGSVSSVIDNGTHSRWMTIWRWPLNFRFASHFLMSQQCALEWLLFIVNLLNNMVRCLCYCPFCLLIDSFHGCFRTATVLTSLERWQQGCFPSASSYKTPGLIINALSSLPAKIMDVCMRLISVRESLFT